MQNRIILEITYQQDKNKLRNSISLFPSARSAIVTNDSSVDSDTLHTAKKYEMTIQLANNSYNKTDKNDHTTRTSHTKMQIRSFYTDSRHTSNNQPHTIIQVR